MGRIAGDNPGYTFRLCATGKDGEVLFVTEDGFDLPSMTTILHDVMAVPPGAMAWWGFRVALKGILDLLGTGVLEDVDDPEKLEELVRAAGVDPNVSLDTASDRGSAAHSVLELLVAGDRAEAERVCAKEEEDFGTHYGAAVLAWWDEKIAPFLEGLAEHPEYGKLLAVHSEKRVWSLQRGYAGTFDLGLEWEAGWQVDDLKTHKPASGFTKPGQGPAYLKDLVQVRGYRIAGEEMGLMPTTVGNRIIIARENGKYLEDYREADPELLFAVLGMYRLLKAFES